MNLTRIVSSLVVVAPLAGAQLPPDHGVMINSYGPTHDIVDVLGGGTLTPIAGLFGPVTGAGAGFLDPVTGELWIGGCFGGALGAVYRVELSGLAASSFSLFADFGSESITGMDYDRNGDIYACDATMLYKVDRATGTFSTWSTLSFPGEFNALCIDQEANKMYAGTFDDGTGGSSGVIEYDLAAGPGPGVMSADLQAMGFDGRVTGLDDAFGLLYVTTLEDTLGQSVILLDPGSGFAFVAPGAPLSQVNGVVFDRKNLLAHLVEGSPNFLNPCWDFFQVVEDYLTLDIGTATVTTIPGNPTASLDQIPHDVVFNDLLDRTEVFPQRPSASAAFTLEVAAHGLPGKVGGTAVTAINGTPLPTPILLGAGFCDSGGFLTSSVPVGAGLLSAGDTLQITSLRFIGGGAGLVIAPSVDVIFVP